MFTIKFSFLAVLLAPALGGELLSFRLPISNTLKQNLGYPRASYLNFTERVTEKGYKAEEHTVVTEDGYILTLFRMLSPKCKVLRTPPVLLMHGLMQNSDAFLDAGVEAGLPYLMADACYDTWLGNKRGTNHGRRHVTLDPDNDAEFWKFSIDEVGYYDFPALIDYILQNTGSAKLNFAGYSQGGLGIIITCTDRPEYNDKIGVVIGIAPATRLKLTRSMLFRILNEAFALLEGALNLVGLEEVLYEQSLVQTVLDFICQNAYMAPKCLEYFQIFDAYNPGSVSNATGRLLFSHFFMGASTRMLAKVGQNFFKGEMVKYDYGTEGNMIKYGTEIAPEYNLTNMVVPTLLITGKGDHLVDIEDVNWLGSIMDNVVEVYNVTDPLWTHFDNFNSQKIPQYTWPKIEEYLSKYSSVSSSSKSRQNQRAKKIRFG